MNPPPLLPLSILPSLSDPAFDAVRSAGEQELRQVNCREQKTSASEENSHENVAFSKN